jgi:hypothetical protein
VRHLATAVSSGLPFGLAMGLLFALTGGLERGLVAGSVAGLAFGVAIAGFALVQKRRLELHGELQGEPVLHQGPANHWAGREARGGWLALTPTRLVFRAHGLNVQNEPLALALAEVERVEPIRTLFVVPNGLRVRRGDGTEERFVVTGRTTWVRAIHSARDASRKP